MAASSKVQIPVVMGYVVKSRKILLIQRHDPVVQELHGKWELPGGKIRFTEDYATACQREILEETGVRARTLRMVPVPYSAVRNINEKKLHVLVVCFECEYLNETVLQHLSRNIGEVRWAGLDEIDPLTTQAGTLFFINYIHQKQKELKSLGTSQLYQGVISLERVDATKNMFRKYHIMVETNTEEHEYKIQCSWGRIGTAKAGHELEVYKNEQEFLKSLTGTLKKRLTHKYRITEITGNIPYIDLLDKFPRAVAAPTLLDDL